MPLDPGQDSGAERPVWVCRICAEARSPASRTAISENPPPGGWPKVPPPGDADRCQPPAAAPMPEKHHDLVGAVDPATAHRPPGWPTDGPAKPIQSWARDLRDQEQLGPGCRTGRKQPAVLVVPPTAASRRGRGRSPPPDAARRTATGPRPPHRRCGAPETGLPGRPAPGASNAVLPMPVPPRTGTIAAIRAPLLSHRSPLPRRPSRSGGRRGSRAGVLGTHWRFPVSGGRHRLSR